MNIVLIGYRGTGKSMVGNVLAEMLHMDYVSMDEEIVKQSKMSIPEIVEKHGWTYFRDIESSVAGSLSCRDNLLIDTGGGVIEREENMNFLRNNAFVIWLRAEVDTIVERISSDTQRPSLTGEKSFTAEVREVLERRTPLYDKYCDFQLRTDSLSVEQIVDVIIKNIRLQ